MAKDRTLTRATTVVLLFESFLTAIPTVISGYKSAYTSGIFLVVFLPLFAMYLFQLVRERSNRRTLAIAAFMIVNVCDSIVLFANIYKVMGVTYTTPQVTSPFSDFVYFSAVTWTTLGYGDITPSMRDRPVAAIEALCGYFVMGLLISVVVIMAQPNKSNLED